MNSQVSLILEVGIRLVFNMLSGRHLILGAFCVGVWNGIVLQRATEPVVAYLQAAWFAFDLLVLNNVARLYLVLGCFLGVLLADFGPDVVEMWEEFQRPGKTSSSSRTASGSVLASTTPAGSGSTVITDSRVTDRGGTSMLTRGGTARSQATTAPSSTSSTTASSVSTLRWNATQGDGGSTITRTSRVTFDEASIANSQSETSTDFGFPAVRTASVRTPGSSSTRVRSPALPTYHQSPRGSIHTESERTPRARESMVLPTSPSGSAIHRPESFSYAQPTQAYYAEELVDQATLPTPIERPLSFGGGGEAFGEHSALPSPYEESPVTPARERSRSPRPTDLLGAGPSPVRTHSRSRSRSRSPNRSRNRSPANSAHAPSTNGHDNLYFPNTSFGASPPSADKEVQIRRGKDLRRQALEADERQRDNDVKRRQADSLQNASDSFLARLQATKEANAAKELHRQAAEVVFEAHNANLGKEDISVEDLRPGEAVDRVLNRLHELTGEGLPTLRIDVGFGRLGLESMSLLMVAMKNHGLTVIRDPSNMRKISVDVTHSRED